MKIKGDPEKFYVDASGVYLGSFSGVGGEDFSNLPVGAIEVATAPQLATQRWNGVEWSVLE